MVFVGELVADLDYAKDSNAEVDLNLVLDEKFEILEIQGTAEENHFQKTVLIAYLILLKNVFKRFLRYKIKKNANYLNHQNKNKLKELSTVFQKIK